MEIRIEIVADDTDPIVAAISKVLTAEFGVTTTVVPGADTDVLRGSKAKTAILVCTLLQGFDAGTNLLAKADHVMSVVRPFLTGTDSCVLHGSGPKPVDLRRAKPRTVARALAPAGHPEPPKPASSKHPGS